MPSSTYSDIPPNTYAADTSMENLDCLQDLNFFAPQQSSPMPDYSDLSQAATQMQVRVCTRSLLGRMTCLGLAMHPPTSLLLFEKYLLWRSDGCVSCAQCVLPCQCCDNFGLVSMLAQVAFAADPDAMDLGQAAAASKDTTAFLVEEARALLSYAGQYQAMEYTAEEHFTRWDKFHSYSLPEPHCRSPSAMPPTTPCAVIFCGWRTCFCQL